MIRPGRGSDISCGTMVVAVCGVALVTVAGAIAPAGDYEQVIGGRADKILATVEGLDESHRERGRDAIVGFSRATNAWHEAHGPRRRELKSAQDEAAKAELAALEGELATIRGAFLERLSGDLSPEQVEKVKDGLTYNVLHVTERAYHSMIETLTAEQKAKIHDWLVEARDLAISEGSSEAKHAVFGKYKGRINNYLSQQGYDLKQEERGWQARRKAAAAAATSTTTEAK
jgi:hypothetical protein